MHFYCSYLQICPFYVAITLFCVYYDKSDSLQHGFANAK